MLVIGVAKEGEFTRSVKELLTRILQWPFSRLLCETNRASLTNQCLTRPIMCTVPDPSPRPSAVHQLSLLRPAIEQSGDIDLGLQQHYAELSITSDVARR